jgi:hypothetical protein
VKVGDSVVLNRDIPRLGARVGQPVRVVADHGENRVSPLLHYWEVSWCSGAENKQVQLVCRDDWLKE